MYAAASIRTNLGQRIKLALVAALLTLSLMVGMITTAQRVDAKPRQHTHCRIIENELEWEVMTGYKADPDFVGGMYCRKF